MSIPVYRPQGGGTPRSSPEEIEARFWTRIRKLSEEGCWIWEGAKSSTGYGRMKIGGAGRSVSTHRYSYELAFGPIPEGMFVCHRCDVPACVRPSHLFLGTGKENSQDMVMKGRFKSASTRLHPEDVSRIRDIIAVGRPLLRELAVYFDVSVPTICDIRNGRTWRLVRREPEQGRMFA